MPIIKMSNIKKFLDCFVKVYSYQRWWVSVFIPVPQVPQQHSGLPPAPPGDGWAAMAGKAAAGDYSGDDGSPRTVIQRTFSLSNLFGLSW